MHLVHQIKTFFIPSLNNDCGHLYSHIALPWLLNQEDIFLCRLSLKVCRSDNSRELSDAYMENVSTLRILGIQLSQLYE